MKEAPREDFRWAVHASDSTVVKPKDYGTDGEIEALTVYAAWSSLRGTKRPLQTGDILEDSDGKLQIVKYVGFEPAQWWVPEPKTTPVLSPETAGDGAKPAPEPMP